MPFTLELFEPKWTDQVVDIWSDGWHEAHAALVPSELTALRTKNSFRDRVIEHAAITRVAVAEGKALGFCMVRADELYQMYVSPAARGTGIAPALIQDGEDRARANGHGLIWLGCAIGNDRAARFYQKSGWTNAGRRTIELDTSEGLFPIELWRFEKDLTKVRASDENLKHL
ncbi:MAG: GNAT family N-acetyltransferase [Pseudomonadota bacterium]